MGTTNPEEQDLRTTRPLLKTKAILRSKIHSTISKKARAENLETMTSGTRYWTSNREGQVQLRMGKNPLENEPPVTVPDLIMSAATKYSHYLAIGSKYKKSWQVLTYIEYYEACRRAAKAFLKVGLERFHGVGIMGINSSEWVIASIGAIMAGGISVGILSSNSPKACQVIAETSEMDIFVVDNDRQLQKVNQIQGYLKHLKAIIQYREDIQEVQPNLYSILDIWVAISVAGTVYFPSLESGKWSGLPRSPGTLSSVASWFPGLKLPASCSWCAWGSPSAPSRPIQGFLMELLREVQPTTFCGIPWVWDHMLDSLKTKHLDSTAFRRRIDRWAMRMGLSTNKRRMMGEIHQPLCFGLAKRLTFEPARKFLGLNHCEQFLNVGMGLPTSTLDFFLSMNIPIMEVYGLPECTGVHTVSNLQAYRIRSCGKELPKTHTKVEKENQNGVGNLCLWGRHIFMGYLRDKQNTENKVDTHGWLHTNDLGFLDFDKFLYIMGKAKDLITLSSGEKVNPYPIEERVRTRIPIVHYAMLVGQDFPYLCALLTLKCQINPETGETRGNLTSEAVACCRKLRSQSTWLSDVLYDRDPIVTQFINQGIEDVNSEAPTVGAKIIKWVILDNDFSVDGGELGPMSKMNRSAVVKIYQEEIQKLYENPTS
ncbi:long-chain-fatty-acid--CoA ligase ACSBG2-like isoform X5 [Mastomys coucha]|uniref:long-chain-fatty-acid--CoA ligase ACSBG2-like isoform X5 n=1 Tax=Mastomys coucha TaxID=35658 RepID=UPI0012620110|nr:long-chain-fatty-acid--CoA ligase ACSBG2-like isoform X5 [Mastomys coucha]